MKKSAKYIYPRPVSRRRHSWRWLGLTACAAAVACLFVFHDDLAGAARLLASPLMGVHTVVLSDMDGTGTETSAVKSASTLDKATDLAVLPAPAAEPAALSSHEIAALAANAEDRPDRPGVLLASVGESISHLQSLPFFLPTPEEEVTRSVPPSLNTAATALTAMFQERDLAGPAVYADNERYTVEKNEAGRQIFRSVVTKGDTAGVILNEWMSSADVAALINAAESLCSLTTIREGRPFSVERDESGAFVRFAYEIDNTQRLVVDRRDGAFVAVTEPIEYDTELVKVRGTINTSLFEAVADAGEGPVLAVNLADVFSCEINFINEIRQGDGFEVLVEKLYRDGEFKGYGKMLAARFDNRGHSYEAYLFPDAQGRLRHYNAQGEALQKTLLKAPLSFTRVSSGYSLNRKHPVFGYSRPHQGVDYAAPTGTPIKAVGDGTITRAGWGNGYGNMIVIKHSGGLESQYAHMSGFARGIKSGLRVKQGQTIGYVGATGVATGPHLDFRLKQNGKFINPTKVIVPREDPVDKKRLPAFREMVASAQSYLDGETALAAYTPEAWPY